MKRLDDTGRSLVMVTYVVTVLMLGSESVTFKSALAHWCVFGLVSLLMVFGLRQRP